MRTVNEEERLGTSGNILPKDKMNIRQANGLGRIHVAMPGMKQTYCGRPINEDDWITASKEANCTGCARAGAPMPQKPGPEDARR